MKTPRTSRRDGVRAAVHRMLLLARGDDFLVFTVDGEENKCVQFAMRDDGPLSGGFGLHGEVLDLADLDEAALAALKARGWGEEEIRLGDVIIWTREFPSTINASGIADEVEWVLRQVYKVGARGLGVQSHHEGLLPSIAGP